MRKIRNNKGLTLIELMIVVVIIGILAALAIPRFSKASDRATEKEADGILKQVYTLQQTYKAQNGVYASAVTDLEKVGFEAPTTLKNYTWAADASIADGACLAKSPATATHSGRKINYGFGLIPGLFNGHKIVSHTGGINGFATAATYVSDDTLSIVAFTNFDGESPQGLVQNLLHVAYGEAPVGRGATGATQAAAPALSPADRDAIVGNYSLQLPGGGALPIKFFMEGSRLMAQGQGQTATELRYLGNYAFGIAADPALRFTFTIVSGKATKVTLVQGGNTIEGPRAP